MERDIGSIGNYYGGLSIKEEGGKFFWSIENYDGNSWQEIPDWLYDALLAFDEGRPSPDAATIAELRATVAEAVRVMEPFARFDTEDFPDSFRAFEDDPDLNMGHFRAARAFTAKHGGSNAE